MNIRVHYNDKLLLVFCLLVLFVYLAPIIVLGEHSSHVPYDNLDSNHIISVLNARNDKEFGIMRDSTPQMMGGLPKVPGPSIGIRSLLYWLFSPYNALLINILLVHFTAFFSMLIFLKHLYPKGYCEYNLIYFLVALSFSLMKFWANAGISIAGLPLFVYGFLVSDKQRLSAAILAIIYSIYSSFVLVGMFALGLIGVYEIIISIKSKRINWSRWFYLLLSFVCYLLVNYQLILSVFGSSSLFVSHRTDYDLMHFCLTPKEFLLKIPKILFYSYGHNSSFPTIIMVSGVIIAIIGRGKKDKQKDIESLLGVILLIAILTAFLDSKVWMSFQVKLPVIKMVQLQRVGWLLPLFHYWLLFLILRYLVSKKLNITAIMIAIIQIFMFFHWNTNLRLLIKSVVLKRDTSYALTYSKFYSEDLLCEIRDFIGIDQSEYRVVSLALEPAVALYSGFYSLEGYSSNYPLEHKRRMRRVIEDELDKNTFLATGFDGWGNKVTIYSDDLDKKIGYPNYWFIPRVEKNNNEKIENLSLNTDMLLEMNCQYLISALEILDPQEKGLEFLQAFENNHSLYRLYLYKLLSKQSTICE